MKTRKSNSRTKTQKNNATSSSRTKLSKTKILRYADSLYQSALGKVKNQVTKLKGSPKKRRLPIQLEPETHHGHKTENLPRMEHMRSKRKVLSLSNIGGKKKNSSKWTRENYLYEYQQWRMGGRGTLYANTPSCRVLETASMSSVWSSNASLKATDERYDLRSQSCYKNGVRLRRRHQLPQHTFRRRASVW
eukprot:GHVU01051643.1.p1 GENE.GHVU01051643.1~~GHVU01051643.1.p1  ORF type:complete len:191 (+),score=3.98 GHVU01051643.1:128-700(+)